MFPATKNKKSNENNQKRKYLPTLAIFSMGSSIQYVRKISPKFLCRYYLDDPLRFLGNKDARRWNIVSEIWNSGKIDKSSILTLENY